MHVIFNKEEAGASIIDFFLDLPDRKRPKRIEIRGSMHDFDWSISEDYASITCAPTAKLLQYMNLFTDIPILWETSFFSNDKPHVDRAALSTSAQHATTTENVDRAHHPETGASHFKDACYWAGIDRSVSACALQPEDYVVLISHPDGGEKCFSVGHSIVYPCAGVTAHTRASKHCSDPAVNQNSTWASSRLEGQPTWLTFLKRVAMNLDRYYSTQSMNGCSGAPILILKHSLRHLRMPILDTSQHSGSVCFEKGFSIGYATAFMPSMFGSSRCPDRVSEEALPHFQAAAQNGDWSPDSISDSFSTRRVRSSSSKLKTPWPRGITGLSATSRDRPPSCDISTTGRQGKDEQVHRSSECRARNGARMLKTKLGMKPSTRKTASSTSKRQEAEYISRLLSLRETVTLTTPHCFRKNYIQQRREAGWKADANNLREHFPLPHSQPAPPYSAAIPVLQNRLLNTQDSREVLMPEGGSSKELVAARASSNVSSSSSCSTANDSLFHANGMRGTIHASSSCPSLGLNRDSRNSVVPGPNRDARVGSGGRGSRINDYILESSSGIQYQGLENLHLYPSDNHFHEYREVVSIDDKQILNSTVNPATRSCDYSSGMAVESYKDGERTDPGLRGHLLGQNYDPGLMYPVEPYPGFFRDIQHQIGRVWNHQTTNSRGPGRDVSHWPPPCRNAREF